MILYVFLLLFLLLAVVGYYFSSKVLYIKIKDRDKIIEYESQNPAFDLNWYNGLPKEKIIVHSPFGYKLSGFYVPAKEVSKKTVIFCHGVTVCHLNAIKYARMFYKRGWNLLFYDQRRHGDSGGKTTSYGYYEKHDLKAVVEYINKINGVDSIIGIHGESMGAAIALQYGGMEDRINFIIADCPYSSLWEQLAYRLKQDFYLPRFPLLNLCALFVYVREEFKIKQVQPLEDVKKITCPILFIHGAADTYVPTAMSEQMFGVKTGYRQIYIAPTAGHAHSIQVDPQRYEKEVFSFLENMGLTG